MGPTTSDYIYTPTSPRIHKAPLCPFGPEYTHTPHWLPHHPFSQKTLLSGWDQKACLFLAINGKSLALGIQRGMRSAHAPIFRRDNLYGCVSHADLCLFFFFFPSVLGLLPWLDNCVSGISPFIHGCGTLCTGKNAADRREAELGSWGLTP